MHLPSATIPAIRARRGRRRRVLLLSVVRRGELHSQRGLRPADRPGDRCCRCTSSRASSSRRTSCPARSRTSPSVFPVSHLNNALFKAFDPATTGAGIAGHDLLILAIWGVGGLLHRAVALLLVPAGRASEAHAPDRTSHPESERTHMANAFNVELSMREAPAEAQARAATALTEPARAIGLRLTKRGAGELGYRPRVQFPFLIMLWHKPQRRADDGQIRAGGEAGPASRSAARSRAASTRSPLTPSIGQKLSVPRPLCELGPIHQLAVWTRRASQAPALEIPRNLAAGLGRCRWASARGTQTAGADPSADRALTRLSPGGT